MTDSTDRPMPLRRSLVSPGTSESSYTPLDAALTTLVQDRRLNDTFRALFGGELRACAVGWPRRVRDRSETSSWLRPGDVLVELARSPAAEALALAVSLHADGATRLAEALLGAAVSSRVPSAAGQPSEAECGLLAYATARLLASLARETVSPDAMRPVNWLVRDVRRHGLVDSLVQAADVVWPIAIEGSLGRLELTLWLSEPITLAHAERHAVEVVLFEHLAPADIEALTAGDVWISDRWSLTNTSDGLTGPVTLQVPGCTTLLDAQLHSHHVRVTGNRAATSRAALEHATSSPIELVLAQPGLTLLELAELAQGARHYVGNIGGEPVLLRRDGRALAEGELVTWRGALGVRLTNV